VHSWPLLTEALLTKKEKKIKQIIIRNPLDDGLDDQTKAQIDSLVNELYEMPKDTSAFERRAKEMWNSLNSEEDATKKTLFLPSVHRKISSSRSHVRCCS